jgi:hypothetical protein
MAKQTPPFGPAGKKLLDGVLGEYALDAHELELLEQAAHCADVMAELQRIVDRDGVMVKNDLHGPLRPNPALVELRSQRNVYVRLVRALQLPQGVLDETRPRPRRTKFEMGKLRGVPGGIA